MFQIVTDPETQLVSCKWLAGNQKKRQGSVDVHPSIISYFTDGPSDQYDEAAPKFGYTRLAVGELRYRAHPNYQNQGPWYDWSHIEYNRCLKENPFKVEEGAGTPLHPPAFVLVKILCFLGDGTGNDDQTFALVHCCEWRHNNSDDSVLTEIWNLEYKPEKKDKKYRKAVIRCVRASCLVGRVFVTEETPGAREGFRTDDRIPVSTRVLLVKPRTEWAKAFT